LRRDGRRAMMRTHRMPLPATPAWLFGNPEGERYRVPPARRAPSCERNFATSTGI
jgi:hypothetical protein